MPSPPQLSPACLIRRAHIQTHAHTHTHTYRAPRATATRPARPQATDPPAGSPSESEPPRTSGPRLKWAEAAGVDQPRPVPRELDFLWSLCLTSPSLLRFPLSPPLRSFVCSHLAGPSSPSPPERPGPSLPWVSGGSPLPYPLPVLARSPPAPHILTAAGRGGREGGRRGWIRE